MTTVTTDIKHILLFIVSVIEQLLTETVVTWPTLTTTSNREKSFHCYDYQSWITNHRNWKSWRNFIIFSSECGFYGVGFLSTELLLLVYLLDGAPVAWFRQELSESYKEHKIPRSIDKKMIRGSNLDMLLFFNNDLHSFSQIDLESALSRRWRVIFGFSRSSLPSVSKKKIAF